MTAQTAARPTRSAPNAGQPLPPMNGADVALATRVLEMCISGRSIGYIAQDLAVPRTTVAAIRAQFGYPDKAVMRRELAGLRSRPATGGPDHPAVAMTTRLTAAVRDNDKHTIGALLANCDRQVLVEVVLAYAVKDDPTRDPDEHMEWNDLQPQRWSLATLTAEHARYKAGAKDWTARAAHQELRRRARAQAS